MDQHKIVEKIRIASEKNGIPEILGLKGKFLAKFYEDVVDINVNGRKTGLFPREGYYKFSSFLIKSLLYFIVTIISVIRGQKYVRSVKRKGIYLNRIVYVAGAYKIVKSNELKDVIPDASIYYYPISNLTYLDNHIHTFNEKSIALTVDTFNILHILKTFWIFTANYKKLLAFTKDIDTIYETDYRDVIVILLKTIYFVQHYNGFTKRLKEDKHIWLLEFHSGMEMLALQNALKINRPADVTIHMQHGTMLENRYPEYHHPVTDYDVVCGEREVRILSELNKYQSKLVGIGCPLQSLGYIKEASSDLIKYDLLVLLTATNTLLALEYQKKVLNLLRQQNDINVLLRFRPASKKEDSKNLAECTNGMAISNGTTLEEDIASSNVIISFSADALYGCFRQGRKIVLIVLDKYISEEFEKCALQSDNLKVITIDRFDLSVIHSMMAQKGKVDYLKDSYVKYNFGSIDIDTYKREINELLESLSC